MNITRAKYKELHRQYRIAFKNRNYEEFFKGSDYSIKEVICEIVHNKDTEFCNKLMHFKIWGF
jgi:hypothetical protein